MSDHHCYHSKKKSSLLLIASLIIFFESPLRSGCQERTFFSACLSHQKHPLIKYCQHHWTNECKRDIPSVPTHRRRSASGSPYFNGGRLINIELHPSKPRWIPQNHSLLHIEPSQYSKNVR